MYMGWEYEIGGHFDVQVKVTICTSMVQHCLCMQEDVYSEERLIFYTSINWCVDIAN